MENLLDLLSHMRASETKILVPVVWCCQSCSLINAKENRISKFCLSQSTEVKISRILIFKNGIKLKHIPET